VTLEESLVQLDWLLSQGATEVVSDDPVLRITALVHGIPVRSQVGDWICKGFGSYRMGSGVGNGNGYGYAHAPIVFPLMRNVPSPLFNLTEIARTMGPMVAPSGRIFGVGD